MLYLYPVISWTYLAIPLVAWGLALMSARRSRQTRLTRALLRSCTTGALVGGAVALLYSSVGGARVPLSQVAVACYLGISALCVVFGLNWLLAQMVTRLFGIDPATGRGGRYFWTQVVAGVIQASLLMAIGLPYLGSILILYRPKAPSAGDPQTLIEATFQTVHFYAADGTPLEGWWIPAAHNRFTDGRGSAKWGDDSVVLCHGFAADKGKDLFLVRDLVANGYNVLAVDLRAHGRSGGQFTGFGGIEARDVLGAIQWLRRTHAGQCHRILGLGEGLGAVALIEAAASPDPAGQAIDAIAAYNPYDDLSAVISEVADHHVVSAGQWAIKHAILPVASAQLGSDLARVRPAAALRSLWPRPLLILGDPLSRDPSGGRSFDLFQSAPQPKYAYWRKDADHDTLLHDPTAALTVRIFFDGERSFL